MSQTVSSRYCSGCMTKLSEVGSCSNSKCRWSEASQPESQHHLPRHYILQGRYYVGRVLGQGGFGVTYIGRDLKLDRTVAIKEFLPSDQCTRSTDRATVRSLGGEKDGQFRYGLERFLNEAQNIARLGGHPNIVAITDHIEANGTAYMIMEFIPGVTLKQYLSDHGGRIQHEAVKSIILHVMAGLRKVHEHGLLHRDISPDNIMLSSLGPVKLIDFGAARHHLGEASQNLSVILKHGYAPEEQYRTRGNQGPWTDVYATAATMYKCVTGEVPPSALDRLSGDVALPRPTVYCPQLPEPIESALMTGLAIKADRRFRSIDEFQRALLSPVPQQPAPPPAAPVSSRPPAIPSQRPDPRVDPRVATPPPLPPPQALQFVPPSLHWFAVLALSAITFGLFPLIWIFVQANWIRKIDPGSRARILFTLYTAFALLSFCILSFGCIGAVGESGSTPESIGNAIAGLSGISSFISLIGSIFFVVGVFDVRRSLLFYYNTVEPIGLRLSGVMTFFFSILYIQYHLSRIAMFKRTGILVA
jgi:serine/threonine protein kinase